MAVLRVLQGASIQSFKHFVHSLVVDHQVWETSENRPLLKFWVEFLVIERVVVVLRGEFIHSGV